MKVIPKTTSQADAPLNSSKIGSAKTDSKKPSALDEALSSASSSASSSSAKVDFSTRAKEIKKAKDIATDAPDVDEAKVARLQAMIDKGEYKVDAKAVADRMVNEHIATMGSDVE